MENKTIIDRQIEGRENRYIGREDKRMGRGQDDKRIEQENTRKTGYFNRQKNRQMDRKKGKGTNKQIQRQMENLSTTSKEREKNTCHLNSKKAMN